MRVVTDAGEIAGGTVETAPTISIADYSRRETDGFGVTTVVERGFARRMSVRLAFPTADVDAFQQQLAALRASPCQWIADDRYAWLSAQGFYKDFELDLATPSISYCTLTIEGLAETEVVADVGGNPAPIGSSSTLRLLQPVTVTNAVLTSSNVPETDYAEWAAGTTYALGARIIKVSTHRIYESVAAANIGHDPAADSGHWVDVGPMNRWAMFDQALGSLTTRASSIVVTLAPGVINAVALLDVTGTSVRVQAIGYDQTKAVAAGSVKFLDLPTTGGAITVTVTGAGSVSIGTLLVGPLVSLGITETSPTAGITDFSRKEADEFGEVTVVERAWAKRMTARALIRSDAVDVVANRIAAVRARPSLWIADEDRDSLTVYGFFRDFSLEVGEGVSHLSLTIEGLSKAPPLGGPTFGADGLSIAEVTVFQRKAGTAPALPTGGSYDFFTKTLTPPAGWTVVPPAGTDPLYAAKGTASIQGVTGSAAPGWAGVGKVAQDGATGADGAGVDVIFTRSAAPPATPAASAGIPAGWYSDAASVPASANPLWGSFGQRANSTSNYTWDTAARIEGATGAAGLSIAEVTAFQRKAGTAPAVPTGGSYDFATKVLTPPASWSTVPPAGTEPLYAAKATASIQGITGSATPTWAGVGKIAQDGSTGIDGAGVDVIFTRSAAQPATPAASAGIPAGWYSDVASVPASANPLWSSFGQRPNSTSNYTWDLAARVEGAAGAAGSDGTLAWTPVMFGMARAGSTFTVTTSDGADDNNYTARFYSAEKASGMRISLKAGQTNRYMIMGFDFDAPSNTASYTTLDRFVSFDEFGNLNVWRGSVSVAPAISTYTTGDTIALEHRDTKLVITKNGVEVFPLAGTYVGWTDLSPSSAFHAQVGFERDGSVTSVAVSFVGAKGDPGPTFDISAPTRMFNMVDGVLSPTSQSITLSAAIAGVATSVAWSIRQPNGTEIRAIASATSVTVTEADLGAHASLMVKASSATASFTGTLERENKLSAGYLSTIGFNADNARAADGTILNISADGVVDRAEKRKHLLPLWATIQANYTKFQAEAAARGVTTEKTAHTNAYDSLSVYLVSYSSMLDANKATAATSDLQNYIKNYHTAEAALVAAMLNKASQTAFWSSTANDNGKRPADGATSDLNLYKRTGGAGTLDIRGNAAARTDGGTSWDTSAVSKESYLNGADVRARLDTTRSFFGLTDAPLTVTAGAHYADADYYWHYSASTGTFWSSCGGSSEVNHGAVTNLDSPRLFYDSGNIVWEADGLVVRVVPVAKDRRFSAIVGFNGVSLISGIRFTPYTDVTAISQHALTVAPAQTIHYDYTGTSSTQVPRVLQNTMKKGDLDVTASTSFTYTATGCTIDTVSLTAGQVRLNTVIATTAYITVTATVAGGASQIGYISVTRTLGSNPGSSGGGSGASSFGPVSINASISDTSYDGSPQVLASAQMQANGSGQMRMVLNAEYSANDGQSASVNAKAQRSTDNSSWTDMGLSASGTTSTGGYYDSPPLQNPSFDDWVPGTTGTVSTNALVGGMTAGTTYYVRWIAYKAGPQGTVGVYGSASGGQS